MCRCERPRSQPWLFTWLFSWLFSWLFTWLFSFFSSSVGPVEEPIAEMQSDSKTSFCDSDSSGLSEIAILKCGARPERLGRFFSSFPGLGCSIARRSKNTHGCFFLTRGAFTLFHTPAEISMIHCNYYLLQILELDVEENVQFCIQRCSFSSS